MNVSTRCTIGGISFSPQELGWGIYAIDFDSGETADGTMERNMVGTKYKYEITIAPIHSGDVLPGNSSGKKLKDLLNILLSPSFTATMPDPLGTTITSTFYVGDRTGSFYNFALDLFDATKFNIIEMYPHDFTAANDD